MERKTYRKIRYIPGMISLVLLPIALSYYAGRQISQSQVHAIKLFWADTMWLRKQEFWHLTGRTPFLLKRNYGEISFRGSEADLVKLDFARIRIREIVQAVDTLNGLHFVFNDQATYGTFVKTIDCLRTEGAKVYLCSGNDIWFYYRNPGD